MAHLPCCKAGFRTQPKSTRQSKNVSTQPCRAARKRLGGSGVEGRHGMQHMPCFQILRRLPPRGRHSLWAHLYFSCFSDCGLGRAVADSQIQQTQHRYGFSLQLPLDPRLGRVLCLPRCWQDRSSLGVGSHPARQAAGVEMAATQTHAPFIPVRLQAMGWIPLKRKRMGGR